MHAEGTAQDASRAVGWAYVGCRVAEVEGAEHRTSSLEAWVYWGGVGQTILVGGEPTPSSSMSLWPLRLRAQPGKTQLAAYRSGGAPGDARGPLDEMTLYYSTPENFHRGGLGVGIGPYWDHFTGGGDELSTPAPVLTVYGSYFITEALRLVSFDATTLDSHLTTDFGVYVSTESMRVIDRRLVINVLLGAHLIGFASQGTYRAKLGIPQGVEAQIIDFLGKGRNLTTGFFLYPKINGISYYNLWLRWGSPRLFGEFNYISWDEIVDNQPFSSVSAGVSLGFALPFARFL
jgi:hypothetical protein